MRTKTFYFLFLSLLPVVFGKKLIYAAQKGNTARVLEILDQGEIGIDFCDNDGMTALLCALQFGHEETANVLIAKGADVNAMMIDRDRPLHLAIRKRLQSCVDSLLSKNARTEERDAFSYTPLLAAAKYGHEGIVRSLIEKGANVAAILHGNDKSTPLHLAAIGANKVGVINLLMSHGASLEARNFHGWIPLHVAVMYGDVDATLVLLNAGSDINATTSAQESSLYLAVKRERKPMVDLLLSKGANVEIKTVLGRNAMHEAARNGDMDIIRALMYAKAGVNTSDFSGNTPLHIATHHAHITAMSALLSNGAEVDVENNSGKRPLDLALEIQHMGMVLIEAGADISRYNATELFRTFWWRQSRLFDNTTHENFDKYVQKLTNVRLGDFLMNSEMNSDIAFRSFIETCVNCEIFGLYRVLRAAYVKPEGERNKMSVLEAKKFEIFDNLLEKLSQKTYMRSIPLGLVEDILRRGRYALQMERLSWILAFASHNFNYALEKAKALSEELMIQNLEIMKF